MPHARTLRYGLNAHLRSYSRLYLRVAVRHTRVELLYTVVIQRRPHCVALSFVLICVCVFCYCCRHSATFCFLLFRCALVLFFMLIVRSCWVVSGCTVFPAGCTGQTHALLIRPALHRIDKKATHLWPTVLSQKYNWLFITVRVVTFCWSIVTVSSFFLLSFNLAPRDRLCVFRIMTLQARALSLLSMRCGRVSSCKEGNFTVGSFIYSLAKQRMKRFTGVIYFFLFGQFSLQHIKR